MFWLLLKSGLEQESSNKNFPFHWIGCEVLNEVMFWFCFWYDAGLLGKIFKKYI